RKALERMRELAREQGLGCLIAPVMPTGKQRYPLAPIERYMNWRRDDGLLFDPWLRTHQRRGAKILNPEPHPLWAAGTVAEWEEWTEMVFPESGEYVIPGGQAMLTIDREQGRRTLRRAERLDESRGSVSAVAEPVDHRRLGVDLFNHTWTLMEIRERTP